jgi:hypothetical protein
MFIGHYGAAFAAKKAAPQLSLGTLFLAAQLMDLIWPVLLLLGLEHVRIAPGNTVVTPLDFYDYPFTHSLTGSLLLSFALGACIYGITKHRRSAIVAGILVFSHWILDFLTHRPDLPLTFNSTIVVGLGLWNSMAGTITVELFIFTAGLLLYFTTTSPEKRKGTIAFGVFIVVLAGIYFGNLFGPPPENVSLIAVVSNAAWIFVLWAYWLDKPATKN